MGERILTIGDVVAATTLCRSLVLSSVAAGEFPKPIKLTARRVGWRESSVDSWIAARELAVAP